MKQMHSDDAAAVAKAKGGDEDAFRVLVDRHSRGVYRLAYRMTGKPEDAEDVVQETFIRAFRSVDRFRGQCQFRTWLMTIGGNVLKDFGRKRSRRQVMPLDDAVRDVGGDPHEHAEATEAEALIAEGLKKLPRMQREVFLLRAQQGLEYEEIAAALATSPGAARVHYHHAVRRLKEIIA